MLRSFFRALDTPATRRSRPRREPYTFAQDIDDLGAVLAHTGARNVIGHGSGGFHALEALRLPIERLAPDPARRAPRRVLRGPGSVDPG